MLQIFSSVFWAFIATSSLVLFPVAVLIWALTSPFDRRRIVLHRFTCFWASLYTWLNPVWRVHVHHRERLHHAGPTVMVANHLSLLDILILFRLFTHFKWVSKIENFRVPFIGWHVYLIEYIAQRRGDKQSVIRMLRRCQETLGAGNSIIMFPEGTRSTTRQMRRFKPGAFELAIKARVPIQPIVLKGTADALPKRGFVLQGRHHIRVRVLDPIPPESFEGAGPEELMEQVRGQMARELGQA